MTTERDNPFAAGCSRKGQKVQRLASKIGFILSGKKIIAAKATIIKVGKRGLEPLRLAAHDPKSCLSANSNTSPKDGAILPYPPDQAGND